MGEDNLLPFAPKKEKRAELIRQWDKGFPLWYDAFPRKKDPARARKAWALHCPKTRAEFVPRFEAIAKALRADVAEWHAEGREARFMPYPATWLRGQEFR